MGFRSGLTDLEARNLALSAAFLEFLRSRDAPQGPWPLIDDASDLEQLQRLCQLGIGFPERLLAADHRHRAIR